MKRVLLALLLLLAPKFTHAQAVYQIVNFATYTGAQSGGYTATIMFRNSNLYSDPYVVTVNPQFSVGTGARLFGLCGPIFTEAPFCTFGGTASRNVGAVQQTPFMNNGENWVPNGNYQTPGCSYGCVGVTYIAAAPNKGLFGCRIPPVNNVNNIPPFPGFYSARTCDADGFTGWLAIDVAFDAPNIYYKNMGTLTEADLRISFTNTIVTPEPSSWALIATGLAAIGAMKRRTSRNSS